MGGYSQERRARFVMFLGLGMLGFWFILGEEVGDNLDSGTRWIVEDGWMHGLASLLTLLGAWKWLNVLEDSREQ
jgi:hypothetical protein